ncbi:MAG: hypothetical protein N2322_06100, partial [Terrimicrobiaceae bacterium]|nr:hypothetical protein [Terrimicrobiaceae bacterium]
MPSLLEDIQGLLERTYSGAGIGLAECVIGPSRARDLGRAAGCGEEPDVARTFLRVSEGALRVAIYYPAGLVERLEAHNPRAGLNDANIGPLIAFIEEINHAVHAALAFQRGEAPRRDAAYIWNLELQAMVDAWLILMFFAACFRGPEGVRPSDRQWLRQHILGSRAERARKSRSW